jgi:hypothetical protein
MVFLAAVAPFALADGLSNHIVGSHHRADVAGGSPTSVDFMGWVTNNPTTPSHSSFLDSQTHRTFIWIP